METLVRVAEAAFAALALALLARIAWHLGRLRAAIAELPSRMSLAERTKDSPTINVNLAGLPIAESPAGAARAAAPSGVASPSAVAPPSPGTSASEDRAAQPARAATRAVRGEEEGSPKEEPTMEGTPREESKLRRVQTMSGVKAIECPRCKSENSSYRIECYNCGASLM